MTMNLVYLADGCEITADVQRSYASGTITVDGRTITVERLAPPYEFRGYGELLHIHLVDGTVFGTTLQPQEYERHFAMIDIGAIELERQRRRYPGDILTGPQEKLIAVAYNEETKQWSEMTDEEMRSRRDK